MASNNSKNHSTQFKFRLIYKGIIVGIFSGLMATAYRYVLSELDTLRTGFYISNDLIDKVIMIILALIGAYIAYRLLLWAPLSGGSGIPQIKGELVGKLEMKPIPTIVSKFIGGSLANFTGLSLGREGPSIQLGGVIGKLLARIMKSNDLEEKYLIAAGSSAGLAAAFNAPISGVMFALEEMYDSFSHYLLLPAMIASVAANYVSFIILGKDPSFSFRPGQTLEMNQVGWIILLGVATGLVGVAFNHLMAWNQKFFKSLKLSPLVIIIAVFLLTVLIGYNYPAILGGGHSLIEEIVLTAIPLQQLFILLITKLIFTSISYNSGVQGGIFLPTLVLGSISGIIIFNFTGLDETYLVNFIIVGMAGVLTAVVRAPIMSIILVMEMTGSFAHLIMVAIGTVVAMLVTEVIETEPIYDTLYANLLERFNPVKEAKTTSEEKPIEEVIAEKVVEDIDESPFVESTFTVGPHSKILETKVSDVPKSFPIEIIEIQRGDEFYNEREIIEFELLDSILIRYHKEDYDKVYKLFGDLDE